MHSRVTGVAWKYLFRRQYRDVTTSNTILRPYHFALRQRSSVVSLVPTWIQEIGNAYHRQENFVIESSLSLQRRDFSVDKSSNASPLPSVNRAGKQKQLSVRSYQKKAKNLLHQVETRRVQSKLVTQKVEELLLLSLSKYDNNVPSDGPLALELLNTALRCAKQSSEKGKVGERLLPRLFSLSCQLMLRSGHARAVNEVHRQLWRLLDGHEEFLDVNDSLYNTHHVNDACSYYIRHVVVDSNKQKRMLDDRKSRQLHHLIKRLSELQHDPSVPLLADPSIDDSLIMLFCNQLKPSEAHKVLRKRVEKSLLASPRCRELEVPLASSFTTIINGYAKTSQPEKALSVIEWMMSFQKTSTTKVDEIVAVPPPNVNCFNGLLHAYALAGAKDAGFKVEQTLEWMESFGETMNLDTRPNNTSYNICINAWARSNHPDAPIRAENLLRHLVALGESGSQIKPSEESFTAVMNTWVNSSSSTSSSGYDKKMKEATHRVVGIVDLMERISENSQGPPLSVIPYTILMKSWEKTAQKLHGMDKQKCGDEILKVVGRMRTKGIAPTTEMYSSILTALVEISPISAVFYFLELEQQYCNGDIQLDTRTFNCGLNAIAVLNRPDAVKRVTDILKRMFEYHETDLFILPSNFTFNIILKVLSRSTNHMRGAAAKADDLLHEMEAMASVEPNFISYVTCIIAWGRSHEKDKIERVTSLMHRFISSMGDNQDGNNKSSIAVFNAVLSVCHHNATLEHSVEALHASKLTMTELRTLKGIFPDQKTYESFFQVLRKVTHNMDSSSASMFTALIEDEFHQCASDGFVTKGILLAIGSAAPGAVFEKLVGKNVDPRTFSIPKAWCRNTTTQ